MRDAFIQPWLWSSSLDLLWPVIVQGLMVSITLGMLGCFLVVRGTSLLGDALSHAVLPGIVMGFLVGAMVGTASLQSPWILVGATVIGVCAAALIEIVPRNSRIKGDASMGIVLTAFFAVGVVLINVFAGSVDLDPGCVLYGQIEFYVGRPHKLWTMLWVMLAAIAGIVIFYRQLLVTTFDAPLATSLGIRAKFVHYAFITLLTLTIVVSFESVGAILAVALLVTPGATARFWVDRMKWMLVISAVHGVISTVIGYWLSHQAVLNTNMGAAVGVAGFGLFLLSWVIAPRTGLATQWLSRWRMGRTVAMENLVKTVEELSGDATPHKVAVAMGLSTRQVARVLARAVRRGWVARSGDQMSLTADGIAVADRLRRAHELWEKFLEREVGLPADHVHDAAEWIEHHLREEHVVKLNERLGGAN